MPRALAIATTFALIIGGGVVHGLATQRWHTTRELASAADRVHAVPMAIGPWQATAIADPEESQARARWARRYDDPATKRSVTVVLECGTPQQLAGYAPEAWFPAHELASPIARHTLAIDGREAAFFSCVMRSRGSGTNLRLIWSWMGDGAWEAPSNTRWRFRGQTFLYRVYLAQTLSADESQDLHSLGEWLGTFARFVDGATGN